METRHNERYTFQSCPPPFTRNMEKRGREDQEPQHSGGRKADFSSKYVGIGKGRYRAAQPFWLARTKKQPKNQMSLPKIQKGEEAASNHHLRLGVGERVSKENFRTRESGN